MNTFRCPKCHDEVEARASEVSHRCKAHKNQYVQFVKVEKP